MKYQWLPVPIKTRMTGICVLSAMMGLGSIAVTNPAVARAPIIYPSGGQTLEKQSNDEGACRTWAQQQTGFNPSQSYQYAPPPPQQGQVLRGAGGGALLGAIGGAIGGNARRGAAIGAGVGATAGLMRRGRAQRSAQQQQQQAAADHNARLSQYNRAFATCMSGRGYSVN